MYFVEQFSYRLSSCDPSEAFLVAN